MTNALKSQQHVINSLIKTSCQKDDKCFEIAWRNPLQSKMFFLCLSKDKCACCKSEIL